MANLLFILFDNNFLNAQPGDEVTFQLTSTTGGPVPVVVPYEVFGSNNQFTLEQPSAPSAMRQALANPPEGDFLVTWETEDEGDSKTGQRPTQQQQTPQSMARKQHQGTIRIGTTL